MGFSKLKKLPNWRTLLVTVLLGVLLSGCAASSVTNSESSAPGQSPPIAGSTLNSDRILGKFGSYGVDIVRQDDRTRVTSLFSLDSVEQKITRTLAVVLFNKDVQSNLVTEHKMIRNGASIGITFRNSGWTIQKQQLYLGVVDVGQSQLVHELMPNADLSALAIQIYQFDVQRDGIVYRYATIAELHHPDYLSPADLGQLFPANTATQNYRSEDRGAIIQSVLDELHH
jgi:hypothetical protein